MKDIKLNLDGGFSMKDGDFEISEGQYLIRERINRVSRGWLGSFAITRYAGMPNTRSTARILSKEFNAQLKIYVPGTYCRVIPIAIDKIAVFVMGSGSGAPLFEEVFVLTDGHIEPMTGTSENVQTYKEKSNPYI